MVGRLEVRPLCITTSTLSARFTIAGRRAQPAWLPTNTGYHPTCDAVQALYSEMAPRMTMLSNRRSCLQDRRRLFCFCGS
ncbi:hypothetical protein BJV78DRAFT_1258930 [Lactifluus subvellereus]|nr:hypothetical protein BJV78DRAFT_1258930 [Lactifluus subvellereus]